MTPPVWALLAVAAGAAAFDWWAVWPASPRARAVERVAKPAVLLALLGGALVASPPTPSVQPWLIAALAASLVGDVLLLPPGRLPAGLSAFLLAHLAFLAAFLQLPTHAWGAAAGAVVSLAVIAAVGRRIVVAVGPPGLRVAVGLYLAAICTMATAATATLAPWAIAGAWLFVASDAQLGWAQFVDGEAGGGGRGGRWRGLGVIATYHLAQACLVIALLGA